MMIIDADTHISPIREGKRISAEELIRRMDQAGVDQALSWLQPECDVSESNHYIYQSVRKFPDRILGFGWADPTDGVEKAIADARKCLYDYDFYGVKLNGAQNHYFIDDEKLALPIIDEIAHSGKLLAFHIGADAPDRTSPWRAAKIAESYPDLRILMVHMGGAGTPDVSDEVIRAAGEYSNLYLVGSSISAEPILRAIKTLGADRVCFGSDEPFKSMQTELKKYNQLLAGEVTDEEKELVLGGNIKRLFGI